MAGGLVAIDTNVLVWGVRRHGPPDMLKRAEWLFKQFAEDKSEIIVPTVALTEYIRPYNTSEARAEIIVTFEERFLVMPFDTKCAELAARLFRAGQDHREMKIEGSRNQLNADSLIIATAASNGADCIYSNNADFRKLAEVHKRWTVSDLPDAPRDLFT